MTEVLFVCTGNICRSPSAALLLQRHAAAADIRLEITSAGTRGADFGPPDALVDEGRAFGINLAPQRARILDAAMIASADLIIGMTREHAREVIVADPAAEAKTFTLREIVRRGQNEGARSSDEELADWLARMQEGRQRVDLLGDSPDDDIADPIGGSAADYRKMLGEAEALTGALRELGWPSDDEAEAPITPR